jgi:hypothetical protein
MQYPFATDLLPDWGVFPIIRNGKFSRKYKAAGTALGEYMSTPPISHMEAVRHAAMMNRNAIEAFWGNVTVCLERHARAHELRLQRRERDSKQGSFSL